MDSLHLKGSHRQRHSPTKREQGTYQVLTPNTYTSLGGKGLLGQNFASLTLTPI